MPEWKKRKAVAQEVTACTVLTAAAVLLLTGTAAAQNRVGPDVVVGELPDVTSAYSAGAYRAWGVGTTSCNLGTEELTWIAETPAHPVIGQNMFRVAGGKIEHLGQAWLKHGFTALQGTVCSTACIPSSQGGNALGLFCSDPYSAGLNDDQDAGPKSEINATTGVFPYPLTYDAFPNIDGNAGNGGDSPSVSSAVDRRLRVLWSEADPAANAGALYFVEGQYVVPDDAQAGNSSNNNTYRRVTISGSAALTLQGSASSGGNQGTGVRRGKPGIFAWRDFGGGIGAGESGSVDTGVELYAVDVPEQHVINSVTKQLNGRFWVGAKVTNLGGTPTLYRYEYAIQNLTSDRSGGSFFVPTGTSTVTAPSFRDVEYHAGEIWSNTDWTSSVSGSGITFATPQTFAQNDRSSALRWGTLNNYGFTSDQAPARGSARLGLFKPGNGPLNFTSVALELPTPGGSKVTDIPFNDSCANATPAFNGDNGFSTVNATSSGPDECTFAGSAAIVKDVWFKYTYTGANPGNVTVSTCWPGHGESFDTKIAVYSGTTCPTAAGAALACNDDNDATCGTDTLQSSVTFAATSGQTFLIRVGGFSGADSEGNGLLSITPPNNGPTTGACCAANGSCTVTSSVACSSSGGTYQGASTTCTGVSCPQPSRPANDLCADAIWIGDTGPGGSGAPLAGTVFNALTDGTAACVSSNSDVWYRYRPTTSGSVVISTDNATAPTGGTTNYDTVLSVHSACGAGSIACDDDGGSTPAASSIITTNLTAGTTYLIRVARYGTTLPTITASSFTLKVRGGLGTVPQAPINDNCNNRAGLGVGSFGIDTTNATTDGTPTNVTCGQIHNDIWFNHPAHDTGTMTVSVCGATFDTIVAIYGGDNCTNYETRYIACNDDFCGTASELSIPVTSGEFYTIRIGSKTAGTGGAATVVVTEVASCTEDIDGSGTVDADDIFAFLNIWFAGPPGGTCTGCQSDWDGDGSITADDIFAFLNDWFDFGPGNLCP